MFCRSLEDASLIACEMIEVLALVPSFFKYIVTDQGTICISEKGVDLVAL